MLEARHFQVASRLTDSKVIGAETAMGIPLTLNDMIDAMIYRWFKQRNNFGMAFLLI